jgi:hypothetical protein
MLEIMGETLMKQEKVVREKSRAKKMQDKEVRMLLDREHSKEEADGEKRDFKSLQAFMKRANHIMPIKQCESPEKNQPNNNMNISVMSLRLSRQSFYH